MRYAAWNGNWAWTCWSAAGHGSRVSDSGRDLLPHILTVLDSVDRLRQSAGEQRQSIRQVRVGTVNTATVPLLAPAIRLFREIHRATQVEVIGAQQAQIQRAILEGSYRPRPGELPGGRRPAARA